jgi:uncharacterized protein
VRKALRPVLITLAILAALYLALVALLFVTQRSFIYPAPRGPGAVPPGIERVAYPTADGLTLHAGYRAARRGYPTILYFHGNGADWQSSVVATGRLVPAGYGVLAAEYRGYRGNPGRPSEHGLYHDGRAAIAFLRAHGVEPDGMVLVGNSIGSGVATQMATEIRPRALVLISPFTSLSGLVAEKIRWLPTDILLRDRFENDHKIAGVEAPVLVLHGDADTLIPVAHARALAAARPSIELAILRGHGHDLAWHPAAEERIAAFLANVEAAQR